jgi:two-component system, cell cycle sensor histidine kinase and response regulator CckA
MGAFRAMFDQVKRFAGRVLRCNGGRARRVLVVDDDPLMLQYVSSILMEAGFTTERALDGSEALTKIQNDGPFDLLLTDVMMPRMSGAELARRVRHSWPMLPVLYVTGFSDKLFAEKPVLWEDEAFLEKPCSPNLLVEAVNRLLTGRVRHKVVWG